MADFLHQTQSYDEAKIREDLENLKLELQDERDLADELEGDPVAQLQAAQDFADANEQTISELKDELEAVSSELRSLVLANKDKQVALEELSELTSSDRFQKIADNLVGIKAKLASDHDFLVAHGVEGRRL